MAITTCQRLSPVFIATWATVSSMFSFMVSKLLCVEDSERRRRRREKLEHHLSRTSQITLGPTIHTSWEDKLFPYWSTPHIFQEIDHLQKFLGPQKNLSFAQEWMEWRQQSFFLLSFYTHSRQKSPKKSLTVKLNEFWVYIVVEVAWLRPISFRCFSRLTWPILNQK